MSNKIWVLGDAVVDLLPEGNTHLLKCPGGAPANVAVGIARLGGSSAFIGCVGSDPFGEFLQQTLHDEQVDTEWMYRAPGQRTSTVVVSLDAEGERQFTFMVRPSADLFLSADRLPAFHAGEGLHLCSIALSAEPSRSAAMQAMREIKSAGGWVSFDPNLREDLWSDPAQLAAALAEAFTLADIIKLSEDELYALTDCSDVPAGVDSFTRRYQPSLLLITCGSQGVYLWQTELLQHFAAPRVEVVDTTGAGDAFVAGLLAALATEADPLKPKNLPHAVQQAQRSGAAATTAKGAMTALPYAADLNAF
ncbi:aminoimidazole riboside kinase [Erwinia sorbitola]|uniref:Aminoimidazole riboside kinase n=1 Tax=Erwinia sorbitola TaxID=2681984 RepID=A0A6I6EHB0_9GAMM|nr:aminoimidazole riboside kinase [Erwinia sorbitola]MTD26159.1 aminoimidazole riboside kinase [Erwinia sorbitola]QGU87305.1 aminoimidazole riboside kinase [Erwinia sorbitola]